MNQPSEIPNTLSLAFSEELYAAWQADPGSVPVNWQRYFERLDIHPSVPADQVAAMGRREAELAVRQNRVDQLVRNYRILGHRIAQLDPLHEPPPPPPELTLEYYGFGKDDLDLPFSAGSLRPSQMLPLREILDILRATYARRIGVQFMHIDDLRCREWLQQRMERCENRCDLSPEMQTRILSRLTDAVVLEEFIQKKYVGAKRFSLEGSESLIPLLDIALDHAGEQGIDHVTIGMAHRGRLNVLANIMGKSPWLIFREFEDRDTEPDLSPGDVKYHQGFHSDWKTKAGREIHLVLCFNPSHLELVAPVANGMARARQDRHRDRGERGLALLIHGDAAFAGEGIIQETLNMSELQGYTCGGTVHVVVNNQIGFTTNPADARSSPYCTDVARMLHIPVFHVNGEDPEAVAQAIRLALDFRREFKRDVVIDMYSYRRRGHNETDEPSFTQPKLYELIRHRPSVRLGYLQRLKKLGHVTDEMADRLVDERREALERFLAEAREDNGKIRTGRVKVLSRIWSAYRAGPEAGVPEVDTGVPVERLARLLHTLATVPQGFTPHPKIERLLEHRQQIAAGEKPVDWAAAEALAMATLVTEGHRVRLTGQDSQRGTFSHRHAVLHDIKDGREYEPLQHLASDQAPCEIYNSPLSETGVLGFEYGFSLSYPEALIAWEAQFGDFNNVAQPIIDQFIAAGEHKWQMYSGLVLLLPHGQEGMGPEHSSARPERFLNLAANDNLQLVNPTTPAQLFHLLRRQVVRPWRKPLVVLTPKSLLRHPDVVSPLEDLSTGRFRRVLPDSAQPDQARVREVLLCTGKVYLDLESERRVRCRDDVTILRVEQLYPFPLEALIAELERLPANVRVTWVQEEPANMGVWPWLRYRFACRLADRWDLHGASRPESASPGSGSAAGHKLELAKLMDDAFAGGKNVAGQ